MSKASSMFQKVYIKTYGCQMNVYDSEIAAGILVNAGFEIVPDESEAEIILLNTCSVRDSAEKKVFGKLGELNKLRGEDKLILGVLGCMAQNLKAEILKKAPYVNIICGTYQVNNIAHLLKEVIAGKKKAVAVDASAEVPGYRLKSGKPDICAYVTIMRGCENFCSYCIVPYVRGKEVSRPQDEIVDEVKRLADSGCKEVTLLGQNVNSYGKGLSPKTHFVDLLGRVNEIKGIERIRFVTSHPKDAGDELFYAMRDLKKVCEYLHLPIQAGSNTILKLMNRGYTREEYKEKVKRLRDIVPGIALSTDIIVGFPFEKEKHFKETLELMQEVQFDSAFLFKYSVRSKTKASLMPEQVEQSVKERRHRELLELQERISLSSNLQEIGKEVMILVEDFSKRNQNRLSGRTRQNKITVFEGDTALIGTMAKIKIINATSHTLYGEVV